MALNGKDSLNNKYADGQQVKQGKRDQNSYSSKVVCGLQCIAPQASGHDHQSCHATSPSHATFDERQRPLPALSKPKLVQAGEAPPLPVVGATVAPRHVLPRPACFYSQISQSLTLPRLICFPCTLRICHLGSVGKVGFGAAGWSGGHFLGSTVTLAVG